MLQQHGRQEEHADNAHGIQRAAHQEAPGWVNLLSDFTFTFTFVASTGWVSLQKRSVLFLSLGVCYFHVATHMSLLWS